MGRTFIRQDVQIANSDVYDDTIAPSIANFETNPGNIETDLNNVRSQLSNLMDVQAGDWYTDLLVPSVLENGIQRGVNNLNTALHAVEKKRVLRDVISLDVVTPTASVASTGILTLTGNAVNNETVTLGGQTYTYKTALTPLADEVLIGATASDSIDNLIAAITLGAGSGSLYAAATALNTSVTAAAGAGDTMDVTAKIAGVAGDSIASTETMTTGSFGGATLSGGADGNNFVVIGAGEIPTQTTAAVGLVSTLGTVVAFHPGTFGTHSLAEVAGSSAVSPINLMSIIDDVTHDSIFSGGNRVYGLMQSEIVTDGHTINSTTQEIQISFVRIDGAGNDLEAVPFADIAGKDLHFFSVERVRLEDLNEQDFLTGRIIDSATGTTVDLQTAFDAQGVTPVDITTNTYFDLEAPGIEQCWRDNLEAEFFCLIEGSAGGTTEVNIGTATDIFNNDAVLNDFLNGSSFDTGAAGTTINVGVTANTIDSGGDLNIDATTLLAFGDGFEAGSTYDTPLVLSDSSAEWDAFETLFGEVSLLAAITAAGASATTRVKTVALATANAAPDTDVGGSGGGTNLDAQLCDYSAAVFLTDVDVYLNGVLLRNGADAAANHDVYPGTSAALGQLRFEFSIKGTGTKPDQITAICW